MRKLFDLSSGGDDPWNVSALVFSGGTRGRMSKEPLISIVDDDQSVRNALKRMLRSLGYKVESFASAADFLRSPYLEKTACLITDVQMPEMTGVDLHSQLVSEGHYIPTILITAYPDEGVRTRAIANGIQAYLVKPFPGHELISNVRSALESRKKSN